MDAQFELAKIAATIKIDMERNPGFKAEVERIRAQLEKIEGLKGAAGAAAYALLQIEDRISVTVVNIDDVDDSDDIAVNEVAPDSATLH